MSTKPITYDGCNFLRQRLVLATLSGKPVKIKNIRSKEDNPGLRDFEAGLIRLLDKITNGSNIVVNETGTSLRYHPGLLIGGQIEHQCNLQRSIGYYLEVLLCLAPFMKTPLHAVLTGITNDQVDPSVDMIKLSTLPILKKFIGTDEGLEIKVNKRGSAPEGGGEVLLRCACRQKLRPLHFTEPGKVKRVRGVAWVTRMSPATGNRIVDAARSVLNTFLPDIYIYTDHMKGASSGKSPGFGLTLVAETIEGSFYAAELVSNPKGSDKGPTVPEDLGKEAAMCLLKEIYKGGCVDSITQGLTVLLMVLGQQDISRVQTGQLTDYTINYLRHIRDFFQVMFKVEAVEVKEEDEDLRLGGEKLILTCVGVGYTNLSKRIVRVAYLARRLRNRVTTAQQDNHVLLLHLRNRTQPASSTKVVNNIGFQPDVDIEKLPDPVPRGDFKPVDIGDLTPTIIAFDLETTDLICGGKIPHITQIAAQVVGQSISFNLYVQPLIPITAAAQQITGISMVGDKMFVNGSPVSTVDIITACDSFIEWLEKFSNVILTAHNGKRFDFPVLVSVLSKVNKFDRFSQCVMAICDSLALFRKVYPGRSTYKQESLVSDILNITYNAHDAAGDVWALSTLLQHAVSTLTMKDFSVFLFSPKAVFYNNLNSREKAKNISSLKVLVSSGICKMATAENIAGSGLNLDQLKKIYVRDGEDGLLNTFTMKNSQGQPRVTNTKRILESVIPKLAEYFNNLSKSM
ncbi:rRNA-processing endoribonuclease [Mactra antiquata]